MTNILVEFRSEDGKNKKARPVIQRVDKHYLGGRVGTHTGDTFTAVPVPQGTYAELKGRRVPVHMVAVS